MHDISEYNTKPRIMLVHSPRNNHALQNINQEQLRTHNFISIPDWERLNQEFDSLLRYIEQNNIEVVDIAELLDGSEAEELEHNPNSIFTRDPLITLPWSPEIAIVSNMSLQGRKREPRLMKVAAKKIGIKHFFEAPPNAKMEGGDIAAATESGARTLYLGIGKRTNMEGAFWLAKALIPEHLDRIICIKHNKAMLHLDTCFCLLPDRTVLCADAAISGGLLIDGSLCLQEVNPLEYFKENDYKVLTVSNDGAAKDEDCNMLFVGDSRFLSFELSEKLQLRLENSAKIYIQPLDGAEISKANGGAHCLTRPIY